MSAIVQVINGEGEFESAGVQSFVDKNELAQCRTNYAVVAIMGPQSSGKSTLLNYVVRTVERLKFARVSSWPRSVRA